MEIATFNLAALDTTYFKVLQTEVDSIQKQVVFSGSMAFTHFGYIYIDMIDGQSGRTGGFLLVPRINTCTIDQSGFIGQIPEFENSKQRVVLELNEKYLSAAERKFSNCLPDSEKLPNTAPLTRQQLDSILDQCKRDKRISIANDIKLYSNEKPDSVLCLWQIFRNLKLFGYDSNYEEAFENIKSNSGDFFLLSELVEHKLAETKIKNLNRLLEEVYFSNPKGERVVLTDIKSKYILLDFWFLKCGVCVDKFLQWRNYYNIWHNQGLEVISVSIDNRNDYLKTNELLRKLNCNWSNYWDKDKKQNIRLGINKYPTALLIANGKIICIDPLINEIEAVIKADNPVLL